jgi:hypothetical protein
LFLQVGRVSLNPQVDRSRCQKEHGLGYLGGMAGMRLLCVSASIVMLACGLSATAGCRAPTSPKPAARPSEQPAKPAAAQSAATPAPAQKTDAAESPAAASAPGKTDSAKPTIETPSGQKLSGQKSSAEKSSAEKSQAEKSQVAKSPVAKPSVEQSPVAKAVAPGAAPTPAPAVTQQSAEPSPATNALPVAPAPMPADDSAPASQPEETAGVADHPSDVSASGGSCGWRKFLGRRQAVCPPALLEFPDPCHGHSDPPQCSPIDDQVSEIPVAEAMPLDDDVFGTAGDRSTSVGPIREFFNAVQTFRPSRRIQRFGSPEPDCAAPAQRRGGWFAAAEEDLHSDRQATGLFAAFGRSVRK